MLASIFILTVSLALLVYWFRYTCLLLLDPKKEREYAPRVAAANRLNFLDVRNALLNPAEGVSLDPLQRSLDRDFKILRYLLEHSAGGGQTVEQRLLMLDFHVMQMWYRLTRNSSSKRALKPLQEMSSILNFLAHSMGERIANPSQA